VPDYAMFLATPAAKNLDRAINNGVWGWTDVVLDHHGQNHSGTTGLDHFKMNQFSSPRYRDQPLERAPMTSPSLAACYDSTAKIAVAASTPPVTARMPGR
jgi:hypothetical protein